MPTYNYGNQENEDTELKKRLNQTAFQQAESGAPLESDTVRQAQELLKQQSATPGKTSGWQSQLNDTINRILNREQFSYDLNGDALYQQYKDNYMTQGKMAMMDTMGQAQAMTGGYGNSYAQGVGQQAYHGYLQQLNDRVPELYQLALSKYQLDGDQLYDRAGMLSQMDRYQKADEQWQKEFDEAKRRYDLEWAQKHPESAGSNPSYTPTPKPDSQNNNIQNEGETPATLPTPTKTSKTDAFLAQYGNYDVWRKRGLSESSWEATAKNAMDSYELNDSEMRYIVQKLGWE